MYPRLSDLFVDLFGIELPFPIYSFGLMVAIAFLTAAGLTYAEFKRMYHEGRIGTITVRGEKDRKGRPRKKEVPPYELIGTLTILAAVVGIPGAKLFHILENFDAFLAAPGQMIFSTGGLTMYGGLIIATLFLAWYVQHRGIYRWDFFDAVGPGLMAAYGIGRIGCHLAGDGDWGIPADMALKPDWLPTWLWAETYPNNILNVTLADPGVYPTPIYEFVASIILAGILWGLRKHPFRAGWLFSLYLIFNGIERFFIEKIRVNVEMNMFGITFTQAELISVLLIIAGIVGLVLTWKRTDKRKHDPPVEEKVAAK